MRSDVVTIHADDSQNVNKPKSKATRPRPVYLWSSAEVQKWLKRFCSDYYPLYWEKFQQHEITGRALVRLNEESLERLGVLNRQHREAIWREIIKLRLKSDILEFREMDRRRASLAVE